MTPIVLYCSVSGTTKKLAERIASRMECDTLRVEPQKKYGNYLSAVIRVFFELKRDSAVTSATPVPDLTSFDTVFIGYPIWYGKAPVFFTRFLKECSFSGKRVIPFSTSGTSHISCTLEDLQSCCTGAFFSDPFNWGKFDRDEFDSWLDQLKSL